jgi:hypothetical protein
MYLLNTYASKHALDRRTCNGTKVDFNRASVLVYRGGRTSTRDEMHNALAARYIPEQHGEPWA